MINRSLINTSELVNIQNNSNAFTGPPSDEVEDTWRRLSISVFPPFSLRLKLLKELYLDLWFSFRKSEFAHRTSLKLRNGLGDNLVTIGSWNLLQCVREAHDSGNLKSISPSPLPGSYPACASSRSLYTSQRQLAQSLLENVLLPLSSL